MKIKYYVHGAISLSAKGYYPKIPYEEIYFEDFAFEVIANTEYECDYYASCIVSGTQHDHDDKYTELMLENRIYNDMVGESLRPNYAGYFYREIDGKIQRSPWARPSEQKITKAMSKFKTHPYSWKTIGMSHKLPFWFRWLRHFDTHTLLYSIPIILPLFACMIGIRPKTFEELWDFYYGTGLFYLYCMMFAWLTYCMYKQQE
ncbi:hypothetical protein [Parasutterella muris]|jgi:hypothetical protein|uniref:Uncharacterized protein n=2 Tax=Parasutterella TaxID=577310 RepID=A0A6L6YM38_9BURK|nr:hypothetical protein [Parasutterella muris]MVX57858.1 hypothetical protein [Parasutterella muris]